MTEEDINIFTRRIVGANRSELVVILYDILLQRLDDAGKSQDDEEYIKAVRGASETVRHLKNDLDFKYAISRDLYRIYTYAEREIAKLTYRKSDDVINNIRAIMTVLRDAFLEIASNDDSGQLMKNAGSVTAGITYGRRCLNETDTDSDTNRGYLV